MIDEIKNAIDTLQIDRLYSLAQEDLKGVANKISTRQLGKRRMEKLHTYLVALDRKRLKENHAFELLLLTTVEKDLGVGLFVKPKK